MNQKDRTMTQKKTKAETALFDIIVYAMMIVAVLYVIVQSVMGNNNRLHFKLTLGLWILAAVVITDFAAPFFQNKFDGLSPKASCMYGVYAVADAAMFVCLYLFIINVGLAKEPLHYVFLCAAVLLFVGKTIAYKAFEGAKLRQDIEQENIKPDTWEFEREEGGTDDIFVDTLEDDEDIQVLIYRDKKR